MTDTVKFAQKVGIVAGALLASIALLQILGGFAHRLATAPIMAAIASERQARIEADEAISSTLREISRDRLDLIDIMDTPSGPRRSAKIDETRRRWIRADRER